MKRINVLRAQVQVRVSSFARVHSQRTAVTPERIHA